MLQRTLVFIQLVHVVAAVDLDRSNEIIVEEEDRKRQQFSAVDSGTFNLGGFRDRPLPSHQVGESLYSVMI